MINGTIAAIKQHNQTLNWGTCAYKMISLANFKNQYKGFNLKTICKFWGIIAISYIIGVKYVHKVRITPYT